MALKIGVNPLLWFNSDFPEIGKHISLEQCLSEAALIGYRGIELEDNMRKPHLGTLLRMRNLELIGGWHSVNLFENSVQEEREHFIKHLEYLHALGSSLVIFCECSHSIHRQQHLSMAERPKLNESQWDFLCEQLNTLHQMASENGFQTAYHHHVGTVCQSSEDIQILMQGTEHLGLLYDTGHLVSAGADCLDVLNTHFSRITHVHVKNVRKSVLHDSLESNASFKDLVLNGGFTTPGDDGYDDANGIHFQPIIDILVQKEYEGWCVVEAEQDPQVANPFVFGELGYSTIKALVDKANLKYMHCVTKVS